MKFFFYLLFFISFATTKSIANDDINNKDPQFLQIEAITGDGIFSILRRYDLDEYDCNLEIFYTLNKLNSKSKLLVGKTYSIPVLIYNYNGKSIRTSIDENDIDLAKRVEHYNEYALKVKLRHESFKDNKKLWVPYHELHCADEIKKEKLRFAPAMANVILIFLVINTNIFL